ncbi:hypothetical protein RIF29_21144 [Crotalaria pallida]|uniref:non-specific serine/threonine protein kinase n=1 Tax=Crotalaria pallida TaxID=3830 RepID=A0AAN9F3Z4_CROPI
MKLLIVLILCCFYVLLSYDVVSALVSDGLTLLSLLSHWSTVPPAINSSWMASDSTPCSSWIGVQCNHAHNVVSLNLTSQGVFGQLGPEIGQLHHLHTIVLLNNSFTGKIPSELGNCSVLQHLDFSKNSFSGEIPIEFGMLSKLVDIDLSFNRLTGEIPVGIWKIQSLENFLVHNNSLFGELPLEMTELKHLRNISLFDNQFSGIIPQSLGINSSLVKLDIMNNRFTGIIPPNLCFGKKLIVLSMEFNQLQGGIPSDVGRCASLRRLVLRENNFTGSLPDFESNSNLKYLDISKNGISGAVPPSLGNCTNLTDIILSRNKFSGLIPSELGKLENLLTLDLCHNNLEGPLPPQLSNCTKMDRFDVGFNFLNGSVPSSLSRWTGLTTLMLRENLFTGGIPGFLSEFENLLELQLGGNLFGGEIPKSIGKLHNLLYGLNLSANELSGYIPAVFGELTKLQSLDVSLNNLTGDIEALDGMSSLIEVNFSYNYFNGSIRPQGILMKLLNSSPSSFMGYLHICVSCSLSDGLSCTQTSYGNLKPCEYKFTVSITGHKRISKFAMMMIGIGSSIIVYAILLVLVHIYLLRRDRQKVDSSSELVPIYLLKRDWQKVDPSGKKGQTYLQYKMRNIGELRSKLQDQVMKATDNLNDQFIIGIGAHGIVYKAQLSPDQVLAVKKFDFSRKRRKLREIMLRDIETVETFKHRNLVAYYDYWFGEDYGVILSKYMENGSLHDVLYEKNPSPPLNWNARLKIAIGIAQGLYYLHYDCRPPIVHRDIKPKNILLDSDMEPLIIDFGTALRRKHDEHSRSPCQTGLSAYVAGTIGYIAPENAYSIVQSRKSDVYSYGVVLLEIITRKKVLDPSFMEEETTLVKWVKSVWMGANNIGEIVDSSLAREFSHPMVAREVAEVLQLALECTEKDPKKRPTMQDVIKFYKIVTMLKKRYDHVDYDTEIAAHHEEPQQYYSPNLISNVPALSTTTSSGPTISIPALIEKAFNFLQTVNSHEDKTSKCKSNIGWRFPAEGWVKVNTHGRAKQNDQARCGGLIRGTDGEWLRGFSMSLGSCPNVDAEIWGLYHGLLMAWNLQFTRVIIETDSFIAVQLLVYVLTITNKVDKCPNPIALCHELIQRDWEVKVQHIFREGNVCASWLANDGCHAGNVVYLEPPKELVVLLNLDISVAANPTHNVLYWP